MNYFKNTRLLHGADYNYEQWLKYPEVLQKDFELMAEAGVNALSIGIFSWSMLEPEEGNFNFDWMDRLIEELTRRNIGFNLATPGGAKPAWLALNYPEVRRVDRRGRREPHGGRHNHCRTSPVYREKAKRINTKLAQRYGSHPGLILWHVNNEYNSDGCYCQHCISAFHRWLEQKYSNMEALNDAWWTTFWSHRFSRWEEIYPADDSVHGMMLDWQRFLSDQTIDFFLDESGPLRSISPHVPVTTNYMGANVGLDYWKFSRHLDVVCWDSYPEWHVNADDPAVAMKTAFYHDLFRSMKKKPFLLMESTPNVTNWQGISIPKRPNMHLLSSLQAVAHGADSVMYFQWRQSRGGAEKFHGAVVGHHGHGNTRVFREVARVGAALKDLQELKGSETCSEVALVYDYQNEWAINKAEMPGSRRKLYWERCLAHYEYFWKRGISLDLVGQDDELKGYKLIIAPMLYMVRPGFAEKLIRFVEKGGLLVTGYLSGVVDENDLCFLGGSPGPLRELLGLWVEDTDILTDRQSQSFQYAFAEDKTIRYTAIDYADLIHSEGAEVLARFDEDFLKDSPALTVHSRGEGRAYYLASRNSREFLFDFYRDLVDQAGIAQPSCTLPKGVSLQKRYKDGSEYRFLMNFNPEPAELDVKGEGGLDLLSRKTLEGEIILPPYGMAIVRGDD